MKNLQKGLAVLLCLSLSFLYPKFSFSQQTLTTINGWNAYVHLPASYSSGSATYPTIIFFPGLGEIGTNASAVISNGPGAYIAQGWNGNVSIDGTTVEFIVISLQPPTAYPVESVINEKIQTIKSLYRVNTNKLYLTGLSHGGWCSTTFVTGDAYGGPYTYASQVAAVVEVEGVIPDDNAPYPNLFDNFANSGGRLLGFEQIYDNRGMPTRINRMNATKPNSGIYVQTNFGGGGHCCWSQFYGGQGVTPGNFTLDGRSENLYQWLARQSRSSVAASPAPNQAPVANAGADISITLPTATATLSGSGTDTDGTISAYTWSKISGPASGTITSSTAASTTVTGLTEGVYQFQLEVKDNSGATATDQVQVTVNAAAVTLSPAVNPANTVTGLDYAYYEGDWSALPSFSALTAVKSGTVSSFDITPANRADQFGFEFKGYISVPSDGSYTFYTTSDDGSRLYIDNQLVVDNDGLHGSTEKSGSIGLKAGKHSITGQFFEQGGDQIFTVSYSGTSISKQLIPSSVLYRVAAVVANVAPVANAGASQSVTTSSALLSGSGTDSDGTIASYSWQQSSGPSTATIVNTAAASTTVSGLVNGTYIFKLTVTDNAGATGTATTQLTVSIVTAPQGTTAGRTVRVNIYGGSNAYSDTKWNNWNISAGTTSGTFLYEDRTSSAISATLGGDIMVVDNGSGYASTSTVPPADVLRYNAAATSQRDLTIKGLTAGAKYNLEFYGSRKSTGNKTVFTIGSKTDTVTTDNNISDYAKFTDITANSAGNIVINMSRIGTWHYISGFSITEQSGAVAARGQTTEEPAAVNPETKVYQGETLVESLNNSVSVYPNLFAGAFKVQISNNIRGEYLLRLSSQSGQTVFSKRLIKQASPAIETIDVSNLTAGVYVLQIISVSTGNSVIHKVVKN
ncbi:MAG: PA14 domain-containing protein [Ferruginibacter sp.]